MTEMVSFAFETAGEECEPAPDLMDMINGGEHAIEPDEKSSPLITSEFPEFGEITEPSEQMNAVESSDSAVESEEEDIEQQIEEAKAAFTNMALMRSRVEEELKDIKESEKGLLKNLKRLLAMQFDREIEKPTKPVESSTEPIAESVNESVEENESKPEEVTWVDADGVDPEWWSVSAESILENVSGIGKKKKDALLAVFSNLKQMEDLRGEASRQFKHFSEVLPDGIGKGLADQIEDAMLQAIR